MVTNAITQPELDAMNRAGGKCSAEVYRIMWPVAGTFSVDPALVAGMIDVESGCHPAIHSRAGAIGVLQLMPHGGAQAAYRLIYGKDGVPTATALHDPNANLWLGIAYLRYLEDHYNYVRSGQARLRIAVAAYNWGDPNVDRHLPKIKAANFDSADMEHWIAMNTPRETRGYVPMVMHRAEVYATALSAAREQQQVSLR